MTTSPSKEKSRKRLNAGYSAAVMACQEVWRQAAALDRPLIFDFPESKDAMAFRQQMYNSVRHVREDPALDPTLAKAWEEIEIALDPGPNGPRTRLRLGRKVESAKGKAILDMLRANGLTVSDSVLATNPDSMMAEESAKRVSALIQQEAKPKAKPVASGEAPISLPSAINPIKSDPFNLR